MAMPANPLVCTVLLFVGGAEPVAPAGMDEAFRICRRDDGDWTHGLDVGLWGPTCLDWLVTYCPKWKEPEPACPECKERCDDE